MKRILLSLLTLIPSMLFADTQTTGNMKLLLPSLKTVDSSRSWADKLNANFSIIDATVTNVQTAIAGVQTATTNIVPNLLASTPAWTGSHVFIGSMTFSSPTMSLAGNEYIWQSSAPQSGNNVLQRNGKALIWGGDNAGSGGGGTVGNTTTTINLFHSGGQVFIATSPLVAIDGLAGVPVIFSTFHAIRFRAYTISPSTVAVTKFQIRTSTSNQGAFPFSSWGPQIHSSTGGSYGTWISTNIHFNPVSSYALHIDSIPESGIPPSTYGVQADGWYDPQ